MLFEIKSTNLLVQLDMSNKIVSRFTPRFIFHIFPSTSKYFRNLLLLLEYE